MKCFGKLDAAPFLIYRPDLSIRLTVPKGGFALVEATEQDGHTVLSLPGGDLVSVQPDGSLQTRPAGQVGQWELGTVDSGIISYTPDANSGIAFVFGLRNA